MRALSGGLHAVIGDGIGPAELPGGEREPHLGRHLHDVRRRTARVPRTLDALRRPERRHPHLDGVTRRSLRE